MGHHPNSSSRAHVDLLDAHHQEQNRQRSERLGGLVIRNDRAADGLPTNLSDE